MCKTIHSIWRHLNNNMGWRSLWKIHVPEHVRMLIWLVEHEIIKTKQLLAKRHMRDPYCVDYICIEEFVVHMLRDCTTVKQMWLSLGSNQFWNQFCSLQQCMIIDDYMMTSNLAKTIHDIVNDYSWSLKLRNRISLKKKESKQIQWTLAKDNWTTLKTDGTVKLGRL